MIDHHFLSRPVTEFESIRVSMQFLFARNAPPPDSVNIARILSGGRIGRHDGRGWQVFAVLDGLVEVTAGVGDTRILSPGEAVQWQPGESHLSIALVDSLVAIIESDQRIDEGT